jgi:hypothetical protein
LFIDGEFMQVPYQSHKKILAKHLGLPYPDVNDHRAFIGFLDDLNGLIARRGIVEGSYTRPAKTLRSSLGMVGTLPAMRRVWTAFRARWPDRLALIEAVSYDVLDAVTGKTIESDFIEGSKIDRKFGRRAPIRESVETAMVGGQPVKVLRNPTEAQLLTWSKLMPLRGLVDASSGDTFWWAGEAAIHLAIANALGLDDDLYTPYIGSTRLTLRGNNLNFVGSVGTLKSPSFHHLMKNLRIKGETVEQWLGADYRHLLVS